VILAFLPDVGRVLVHDGTLITSGIIDTRADDVLAGLAENNLAVKTRLDSAGWVGLACGFDRPE
jgi:ribosomal protein L11 methylase PrmA